MNQNVFNDIRCWILPFIALCGCSGASEFEPWVNPKDVGWRVDSLNIPGGSSTRSFIDLWGTNRSNLHAVARTDNWSGQLWHFNGTRWSEEDFPRPLMGGYFVSLDAIHGTDPTSIWAVGVNSYIDFLNSSQSVDSSYIIHYDGSRWKVSYSNLGGWLFAVHAMSQSNVWAGGEDSLMMHFDGASWTREVLPVGVHIMGITHTSNGRVYAVGMLVRDASEEYYLLTRGSQGWEVVDHDPRGSSSNEEFGVASLIAGGNDLFTVGYGVYHWSQGVWRRLLGPQTTALRVIRILPNSGLLAGNLRSTLFYNDGVGWTTIRLPLPDEVHITGIWSDGKDYVVTGHARGLGKSYYLVSW